ncbi:hypothetical protein PG985_011000 [Apiospora marii]|uniref:uncharacterized protein n=1 Tax=Apiospora marii TaxID=335849 RepID=UPI00312F78E7
MEYMRSNEPPEKVDILFVKHAQCSCSMYECSSGQELNLLVAPGIVAGGRQSLFQVREFEWMAGVQDGVLKALESARKVVVAKLKPSIFRIC